MPAAFTSARGHPPQLQPARFPVASDSFSRCPHRPIRGCRPPRRAPGGLQHRFRPSPTPSPTAAAATPAPTPVAAFPFTLVDDEGTSVTIHSRPERIVSLTPATTEILFAIGAGPRVVATTDFDDYPPEAVALPDVASYQGVDVEKIVGLAADLVVAGGNGFNSPDALRSSAASASRSS